MILLAACGRGGAKQQKAQEEPAAPPASVVSIGNELGACTELPVCDKQCDGGLADACRRLGVSYEFGKGGATKDETRAAAFYSRACALKEANGCLSAGRMYEFAHGVAKDEKRAESFYDQACSIGFTAGCYNDAIMLENGRGVAKDLARAAVLYDRACNAGSKTACESAKSARARLAMDDAGAE